MVTVDTEALPARAEHSHVGRLIWGRYREGSAGITEIARLAQDASFPFLFFLEMASASEQPVVFQRVAQFLQDSGQDIELHFHPEILGRSFWRERGARMSTTRQDLYARDTAHHTLEFAAECFSADAAGPKRIR